MEFKELNSDQRREAVNTQQRYAAFRDAKAHLDSYRGSMVWGDSKGRQYLLRSSYDKAGIRRQSSIGLRAPETEHLKLAFERGRREAQERFKDIKTVIARQTAINRALGLGRVPLVGANIIRALDNTGLLGSGIRVLGTNAIYAYEAAAGVRLDSGLTATEDIDLLLDSQNELSVAATEDISEPSLLRLFQKVDHSFQKSRQTFRAVNRDGYLIDLIKPLRSPPWTKDREKIGGDPDDLSAAEIEGLTWHENAPAFEAIAIDEKGGPLRIVATDPRVWAAHKLWVSERHDRDPIKRRRDAIQARTIARLVTDYLPHLPFVPEQMKMLPRAIFDQARPLFA